MISKYLKLEKMKGISFLIVAEDNCNRKAALDYQM